MRPLVKARDRRRGSTMVEFALCMAFLTPLLLGTFNVGMNLGRNLQVTQLSRNIGHMYVRWVDFSQASSQNLALRLAEGLNMSRTGGDGVVILSQIMMIGDVECGNLGAACTNRGQPVFIHRIVFGNTSLRTSRFGTPSVDIDASGAIASAEYLKKTGARTSNWSSVMTLNAGETAFVTEVYVQSPAWKVGSGIGTEGVYARSIY